MTGSTSWRRIFAAAGLGMMLAGIAAGPAAADPDDWHHDRGRHEGWEHGRGHWRHHEEERRVYVAPPPAVVVQRPPAVIVQPPAVYAPPPVVVVPPPPPPAGLNIIVPLHIN